MDRTRACGTVVGAGRIPQHDARDGRAAGRRLAVHHARARWHGLPQRDPLHGSDGARTPGVQPRRATLRVDCDVRRRGRQDGAGDAAAIPDRGRVSSGSGALWRGRGGEADPRAARRTAEEGVARVHGFLTSTTQTSLWRSLTGKKIRFPSLAHSTRYDGRVGSSNRTSSFGVPPVGAIDQSAAVPSESWLLNQMLLPSGLHAGVSASGSAAPGRGVYTVRDAPVSAATARIL